MHGDVVLAGPIWWAAVALFLVAWLFSAFTMIDSLRTLRAERFAELPESRWLYFVPSAAFFVAAVVSQFAGERRLAVVVVAAAPFVLVLGMVYLLRAVFPKHDTDRDGGPPQA